MIALAYGIREDDSSQNICFCLQKSQQEPTVFCMRSLSLAAFWQKNSKKFLFYTEVFVIPVCGNFEAVINSSSIRKKHFWTLRNAMFVKQLSRLRSTAAANWEREFPASARPNIRPTERREGSLGSPPAQPTPSPTGTPPPKHRPETPFPKLQNCFFSLPAFFFFPRQSIDYSSTCSHLQLAWRANLDPARRQIWALIYPSDYSSSWF